MPRTSRRTQRMDQATALRTLSHLFDTTGAGLPPAEPPGPTPSSVAPYAGYNSSFGRPACSCSRCLKRAGPVTDNAGDTIDDIAQYLEDNVFNDETDEAFPPGHFSEPAEELVRLVERGDANSLRPLLDEFTEDVQAELATMLAILAAQHGHANIIHLLGEYGADFEDCDETRGGPPLMHAANNGHAAAVTALIKNGANPDSVDWDSNTALMVAIFSDRSSAAEALLEGGADPEAEDEKGRTALSHAARYGSIDCIHVLAQFNANVFHKDHDDRTPVEIAEDSARTEATAILKRLQQRQRLRERRDAKARSGPKQPESVNPVEQARRAEEARLAAEALLAEEAASKAAQAEAKAAKKAKQKKAKHKAVAEDHAADAASQHMNGLHLHEPAHANGHHANGQQRRAKQAQQDDSEDAEQQGPADEANERPSRQHPPKHPEGTGAASKRAQKGANHGLVTEDKAGTKQRPEASTSGRGTGQQAQQAQQHGTAQAAATAAPAPPSEEELAAAAAAEAADEAKKLRQQWDDVLHEAACCFDKDRQQELLEVIIEMSPRVVEAGISTKYGKKVVGKLEKVGPVRAELWEALTCDPPDRPRLQKAVEKASSLRSLVDPALLADADALVAKLLQEEEHNKWASLMSQMGLPPDAGKTGGLVADNYDWNQVNQINQAAREAVSSQAGVGSAVSAAPAAAPTAAPAAVAAAASSPAPTLVNGGTDWLGPHLPILQGMQSLAQRAQQEQQPQQPMQNGGLHLNGPSTSGYGSLDSFGSVGSGPSMFDRPMQPQPQIPSSMYHQRQPHPYPQQQQQQQQRQPPHPPRPFQPMHMLQQQQQQQQQSRPRQPPPPLPLEDRFPGHLGAMLRPDLHSGSGSGRLPPYSGGSAGQFGAPAQIGVPAQFGAPVQQPRASFPEPSIPELGQHAFGGFGAPGAFGSAYNGYTTAAADLNSFSSSAAAPPSQQPHFQQPPKPYQPQVHLNRPVDAMQQQRPLHNGLVGGSGPHHHHLGTSPQQLWHDPSVHAPQHEESSDLECVVCLAAHRSMCCIPCGHVAMCAGCSAEVEKQSGMCPICRARIEYTLQIIN